jgi:hypothetical protein
VKLFNKTLLTPRGEHADFGGMLWTKFELFSKKILMRKSETIWTRFCGSNFLGKRIPQNLG